jgi:Protein SCAI
MVTLNFHCSYEPEDALEWALVLDEIKGFIKADAAVSVLHADSNPIVLSHRCVLGVLDKTTNKKLKTSSFFVVVIVEFHFIFLFVLYQN